jgi:hypothetical protein
MNEGLSEAAGYLYGMTTANGDPSDRMATYNDYYNDAIGLGDNFYVWDNRDLLTDYATAYMFFQWLRLQSGGIFVERSTGKLDARQCVKRKYGYLRLQRRPDIRPL